MTWKSTPNRPSECISTSILKILVVVVTLFSFSQRSEASNTVPFTSASRANRVTPFHYFSGKSKSYSDTFIQNYLGAPTLSTVETDRLLHNHKHPLVPFFPFGIDINFNIVLSISDGSYAMVEFIRIDLEHEDSIWFVLDSKFNGQQFIGLPEDSTQKKRVAKLAEHLNIPTYEAYFQTPKINEGAQLTVYSFSYTRKDPEEQEKDKKMKLEVFVSHDINVDKEHQTLRPRIQARNSSTMNHSESTLLVAKDIYKTTPLRKMSKLTVTDLNSPDGSLPLQKILDVELKSLISQTLLGLRSGSSQISSEGDLTWNKEDNDSVIYVQQLKQEDLSLQHIEYRFLKRNGKLQLQSIRLKQSALSETIGTIDFNPALPDLRYELQPGVHRSKVAFSIMDITTTKNRGYFLGELHVQNDVRTGGHLLELLPGNATVSARKSYRNTPEWLYKRGLISTIAPHPSGELELHSHIMSPQRSALSTGSYQVSPQESAKLLQAFDISWDVQSHPLSRLVVKSDDAAEQAFRQQKPDRQDLSYGLAYMEGGLWSNGRRATDLAMGTICQKELFGAQFYTLSSHSFPLRLSRFEFPYNKQFYRAQEAKVEGIHKMSIHFPEEVDLNRLSISLNGFMLRAGPNHKATGITSSGFTLEIIQENDILLDGTEVYAPRLSEKAPNIVEVYVRATQNFGPSLSKPISGPWRQDLSSYSALANIDILIIEAPLRIEEKPKQRRSTSLTDFHIGRPDPLRAITSDRKICLQTEGKRDLNQEGLTLLTSLSYLSAASREVDIKDEEKLEAQRDTRNIRAISLQLGDINAPNQSVMMLDNTGTFSWATRYVYTLGYSVLQPFSAPTNDDASIAPADR